MHNELQQERQGNMKRATVLTLVILSIVIIFISSCSPGPSESTIQTAIAQTQIAQITNTAAPVSTDVPVPTATSTPTATQEPEYFLGDAVYKNGYALTALSVQDPFIGPWEIDTNNKFIAVEVIISNISAGSLLVDTYELAKVVDKDGFSYPSMDLPSLDGIFHAGLEPGEKIKGNIVFETPATFVPSNIIINISFLNPNREGPQLQEEILLSLKPVPAGHVALAEPNSESSVKTLPTIGTPITKDGYSLTVLALNGSATVVDYYGKQEVGYKYVGVQILLENVSGTIPLEVATGLGYLIDDRGFLHQAWDSMSGEILSVQLAPGEKAKGWVLFPIPEGVNLYGYKYIINGGSIYVNLESGLSQ